MINTQWQPNSPRSGSLKWLLYSLLTGLAFWLLGTMFMVRVFYNNPPIEALKLVDAVATLQFLLALFLFRGMRDE